MKISVVAPSLQLGGLENAASLMANYLCDTGHEVSMVLCYRTDRFYQMRDQVAVHEPPFYRKAGSKVLFYLSWLRFLRRVVKHTRPDVVLAYGDFHNALVLLALAGAGVPIVISDRASPGLSFPPHVAWLRRRMYRRANGIVAQTERAAESKRTLVGHAVPVEVIPNPVREFEVPPIAQRARFILAAARHYPVKGLDRLISAFARIDAPDWSVYIAGSEGPATSDLKSQVAEYQLGDRVRFLGAVRDMGRLYASAGLFVLPSRSEGYPNALLEAMATGCPSIAFDINAGPADIIKPGVNGMLVPDGDIGALARSIQRLVEDDQRRETIGRCAAEVAHSNSLSRIGGRMEAFLAQVAGLTSRPDQVAGRAESS